MLRELEQIIGKEAYSVFLDMLQTIGPHARTHRISVVIAALLRYACHHVPDKPEEGSLGEALLFVREQPSLV